MFLDVPQGIPVVGYTIVPDAISMPRRRAQSTRRRVEEGEWIKTHGQTFQPYSLGIISSVVCVGVTRTFVSSFFLHSFTLASLTLPTSCTWDSHLLLTSSPSTSWKLIHLTRGRGQDDRWVPAIHILLSFMSTTRHSLLYTVTGQAYTFWWTSRRWMLSDVFFASERSRKRLYKSPNSPILKILLIKTITHIR